MERRMSGASGASTADIKAAARRVLDACRTRHLLVATAESCTGGLVAGALTDIAGSSEVVDRGFVTYSDQSEQHLLDVPPTTVAAHGTRDRAIDLSIASRAL